MESTLKQADFYDDLSEFFFGKEPSQYDTECEDKSSRLSSNFVEDCAEVKNEPFLIVRASTPRSLNRGNSQVMESRLDDLKSRNSQVSPALDSRQNLESSLAKSKMPAPAKRCRDTHFLNPVVDLGRRKRRRDSEPEPVPKTACKCRKSRCLKLYCECFRNGLVCGIDCTCEDCFNIKENEKEIAIIKNKLLRKNKLFKEITENPEEEIKLEQWGCTCKNSKCEKKYCECLKRGVKCSSLCKCEECKNGKECGKHDHEEPEIISIPQPVQEISEIKISSESVRISEQLLGKREQEEDDWDDYTIYHEIGQKCKRISFSFFEEEVEVVSFDYTNM